MFKFSIIIPTYNREKFINRTVESVLKQNFQDWEMIIVDDGSTDSTKEVLEKYLSKYRNIKYFYKENGGVGSARNYGIKKAKGDYLIFLDSDDELTSFALQNIVRKIAKYPKFKIFFFSTISSNQKKLSTIKNKRDIVATLPDVLIDVVSGEFLPCVDKKIFLSESFPENVNGGESLLWWQLIDKHQAVFSHCIIRIYHFDSSNSLTRAILNRKLIQNNIKSNMLTIQKYKKQLKKINKFKLGEIYFVLARMNALLNRKSWRYFKLGIKYRGCNFKNICLYVIAILDYRCLFTNCLLRVNLFINNLKC